MGAFFSFVQIAENFVTKLKRLNEWMNECQYFDYFENFNISQSVIWKFGTQWKEEPKTIVNKLQRNWNNMRLVNHWDIQIFTSWRWHIKFLDCIQSVSFFISYSFFCSLIDLDWDLILISKGYFNEQKKKKNQIQF